MHCVQKQSVAYTCVTCKLLLEIIQLYKKLTTAEIARIGDHYAV